MIAGSCLCGGIRYEISGGQPKHMSHCHCSLCRKFHGAAFATYVGVHRDQLAVTAGTNLLKSYTTPNGSTRTFCSACGSSLFWANEKYPAFISAAAGTLDTDPESRATVHIHVDSKAPWYEITDDLEQQAGDNT